jgi:large subunit ribosomal protein L29
MAAIKLKNDAIRKMTKEERRAKLEEICDELMHEKGVKAMGGAPTSPGRVKALRNAKARLMTIMRENKEI